METNLSRWGGWEPGAASGQGQLEVRGKDFLGVVVRSKGAALGPLELDVFSWLTARWFESGRSRDGLLNCTLYELGVALYGRKPSGKEVRLIRGAIENLAGALITIGGFNAHSGETKPKLASMVHLVESAVWAEDIEADVPTREDGAETGALRGNSYEIKLASWLVRQLEKQYVTYLDWRVQRQLGGLAKRLWIYLEAERFKAVGDGREKTYIILGDKAYTALGVRHAREVDRRKALRQAGERIAAIDDHYEAVVVERNPVDRKGWRILATRLDRERAEVRRTLRAALQPRDEDAA